MYRESLPENLRRGAAAEDLAADYLRLRGFEIVERNVRVAGGEIDLVARRGEWLVLVEVRFRGSCSHGHPVETVCGRKARAVGRAARAYLAQGRRGASCWRFDVVTVTLEEDGEARVRQFPGAVSL